jgi:hypothetical protein
MTTAPATMPDLILSTAHGRQIVPRRMVELLSSRDREASGRVQSAMQNMDEIEVTALEAVSSKTRRELK